MTYAFKAGDHVEWNPKAHGANPLVRKAFPVRGALTTLTANGAQAADNSIINPSDSSCP